MNNILKMDSKLITIIAIVITFILGLLVGRITSDRYYFMKDTFRDGIAVYRCDKVTGHVEILLSSETGIRTIKMK